MRHHSLLMGVQNYRGSPGLAPLSCARADVDLMASVFGDPTLMGGETRVQKVLDPTYDEAKRSLRAFFEGVDREDVVVLYFSGHGMRDASGGLFLCLTDSDENDLELTALPFQTLGNVLRNKFLQRVVVLLDCCYSGAAGFKDSMKSKFDEAEQVLENGKGTFILSSSGHAQTSKEGDGNSIFTRALVEGIRSGAADMDEDGNISVQELADYIAMEVPRHTPGQDPQISSRAARGTFLVAVNEARRKAHEDRMKADAPPTESDLRRDILRAARSRLIGALESGDVRKDFFDDVHDWIGKARNPSPTSPHMRALRAYGAREIGLMELHDLWRKSGQTTTMAPTNSFAEAPQAFVARPSAPAPQAPAPEIASAKGASFAEGAVPEGDANAGTPKADEDPSLAALLLILLVPVLVVAAVGYFWASSLLHGVDSIWLHAPSSAVPPPPLADPTLAIGSADDHFLSKIMMVGFVSFIHFLPAVLVVTSVLRLFDDYLGFITTALIVALVMLLGGLAYVYVTAPVPWAERFDTLYLYLANEWGNELATEQ